MTGAEVALSALIGVATGVTSSLAAWWWLNRALRPRLMICPTVAEHVLAGTDWVRAQVKLRNVRRRRAVDVRVFVRLKLPDLIRRGSTEVITLLDKTVPTVEGRKSIRWTVRPEHCDDLNRYYDYLPAEIVERHRAGDHVSLRKLMSVVEGATLGVYALSFDERSGGRGYAAASLALDDFRKGRFLYGDSCAHSGVVNETGTEDFVSDDDSVKSDSPS